MSHNEGTLDLALVALRPLFSGCRRSLGSHLLSWALPECYLVTSLHLQLQKRERELCRKEKKNLDVGVVLFWSVSFGRGKDTKLNGFMHGGEKW